MDKTKILALAAQAEDEMTALRHELHRHPESGWQEVRTTDAIERELKKIGCAILRRGFAGTRCGIVCDVNPDSPGPCVAVRADIDALAVTREDNDLEYASAAPGVMHACGHDAHAASLLGAAKIFKALEKGLPGRVRLMFQPSEEQATAPGAKALIEEGMLDGVDAVIGYHVRAGAPEGEIPPGERVVISIGTLKSGSAVNVIPEKCEITGNIRTTNPDIRATLPERIERIAQGVGLAMRCRTDFRFIPVYPSVVNDEAMGLLLEEAAGELFGAEKVKRVPISSGSDDFNFYSAERPSIYFNVGMGGPGTPYAAAHHSPQFRTNDAILKTCAAAVVATACKFLEAKTK